MVDKETKALIAFLLLYLGVVVIPLILGYATLKNSKPIYNFYKAMFGEKYINPTYMAVGVVLLVILFQFINGVVCGPKLYTRDDGVEIADWDENNKFICGSHQKSLSMERYISFILFLIIAYYLYKNNQIKLTENKLLVISIVILSFIIFYKV